MQYTVLLFHSSNHAIWADRILKRNGINRRMIPVPRNLSSDCGYCVRFFSSDLERVKQLISEQAVEYDRFADIGINP